MFKHQSSTLDRARSAALYFTMSAAILGGVFWLATLGVSNPSNTIQMLRGILSGAVTAGGVAMGLLYLAGPNKKK